MTWTRVGRQTLWKPTLEGEKLIGTFRGFTHFYAGRRTYEVALVESRKTVYGVAGADLIPRFREPVEVEIGTQVRIVFVKWAYKGKEMHPMREFEVFVKEQKREIVP